MTDKKYIRIGFFENFKGEDSVLIEADIYGLLELEDVLLNLTENKKVKPCARIRLGNPALSIAPTAVQHT